MPDLLTTMRWRWATIALLATAALAGCVSLDTQQRKWTFQASVLQTPDDGSRIDGLDDVWFDLPAASGTARLHGL